MVIKIGTILVHVLCLVTHGSMADAGNTCCQRNKCDRFRYYCAHWQQGLFEFRIHAQNSLAN